MDETTLRMSNFWSKIYLFSDITQRDIRQYCGSASDVNLEVRLDEYWLNMAGNLPNLFQIALDYIWSPISSCSVERSFSKYNTILDDNRQNLSEESLHSLNMLYYNGSLNI